MLDIAYKQTKMRRLTFVDHHLIKYAINGATVGILYLLMIDVLVEFGFKLENSVLVSYCITSSMAYYLHGKFSFRAELSIYTVIKFILSSLTIYFIVKFANEKLRSLLTGKSLYLSIWAMTAVINYAMYRLIVFRNNKRS